MMGRIFDAICDAITLILGLTFVVAASLLIIGFVVLLVGMTPL